jgi:hypothetical protein
MDSDPDPGGPKTCESGGSGFGSRSESGGSGFGSRSATLQGTSSKLSSMSNITYLCSIHFQDVILACAILHNIAIRWNAEEFAEEEEEEEVEDAVRDDGYGWDVVPPEEIVHVENHPHQEKVECVLDEEWEAEQHFVPGGDAEAGDIARRQHSAQRREALRDAMLQQRYWP